MPRCLFLFSLYVPGEVAYDVAWFQRPALAMENGPVPLISMDHWGVVKKSGGNESSRCTIERTDRDTFVLSVYHVKDRDVGEYYCTAKLWHFSPDTQRWSEGRTQDALPVFLSINLACKYHAVSLYVIFTKTTARVLISGMWSAFFLCLFSVGLYEEPSVVWPWSSSICWSSVYRSWPYHFSLLLLQKPNAHSTQQAHWPWDGLSYVTPSHSLPPANVTSF